MGFRTVVMLNNDHCDRWANDPDLGKKIQQAMNFVDGHRREGLDDLGYGRVVECTHADTKTLAILDFYTGFKPIAYSSWLQNENEEETKLRVLKEFAASMGYHVRKPPVRKRRIPPTK